MNGPAVLGFEKPLEEAMLVSPRDLWNPIAVLPKGCHHGRSIPGPGLV